VEIRGRDGFARPGKAAQGWSSEVPRWGLPPGFKLLLGRTKM